MTILDYSDDAPVSRPLTDLFGVLKRSDFQLVRNYSVLTSIENNYAKWPKSFGNAIFLDSNYLYTSLADMMISNAEKLFARQ